MAGYLKYFRAKCAIFCGSREGKVDPLTTNPAISWGSVTRELYSGTFPAIQTGRCKETWFVKPTKQSDGRSLGMRIGHW